MWEFSCSSLKEKEDKWLKGPGVRPSACGRVCGRSRDLAGGWSLVWYKGWRETGLGGAGTSWEEERHKEDVSGQKSCLLETESKYYWCWASLMAQMVKNRPEMQETWIRSLDWEDPLEKGMAVLQYSCSENPHGQRSLARYSPWCHKESDKTKWLTHTHYGRCIRIFY